MAATVDLSRFLQKLSLVFGYPSYYMTYRIAVLMAADAYPYPWKIREPEAADDGAHTVVCPGAARRPYPQCPLFNIKIIVHHYQMVVFRLVIVENFSDRVT